MSESEDNEFFAIIAADNRLFEKAADMVDAFFQRNPRPSPGDNWTEWEEKKLTAVIYHKFRRDEHFDKLEQAKAECDRLQRIIDDERKDRTDEVRALREQIRDPESNPHDH